jgi:hypothetical protein
MATIEGHGGCSAMPSLTCSSAAGRLRCPVSERGARANPPKPAARSRASHRCLERRGPPAARATSDTGIPSWRCGRSTATRAMACWRCASVTAARAGATACAWSRPSTALPHLSRGVRKRVGERTGRCSRGLADQTWLRPLSLRWYDIFCIAGRLNVHCMV